MSRDTSRVDDGGPAFPQPGTPRADLMSIPEYGMSLRDWFAGQAAMAAIAVAIDDGADDGAGILDRAARYAYEYADAMLAARGGGSGPSSD